MSEPIKVHTIGEAVLEYLNREPAIDVQEHGISLKPTAKYDYFVKWEQVASREGIIHLVVHLSNKRWCTVTMIREFIEAACHHHNLPVHD